MVWEGWDPQLRRTVWLLEKSVATPLVDEPGRTANRATHLRWLQGHRSNESAWDAYDAPSGNALAANRSLSWPDVAGVLADVARELAARGAEAEDVVLSFDRVWITADRRGLLLDFSAPRRDVAISARSGAFSVGSGSHPVPIRAPLGAPNPPTAPPRQPRTPQQWLADVARAALGIRDVPLPVSASAFLDALAHDRFNNLEEAATAVERLENIPDSVSTQMRANTLLLSAVSFVAARAILPWASDTVSIAALAPAALSSSALTALLSALGAAISAWFASGGVWLATNRIAVVHANGRPVSRPTAIVRALIAWSWVFYPSLTGELRMPPQFLAIVLAVLWRAASQPTQGLVDRLLGTRLVPR